MKERALPLLGALAGGLGGMLLALALDQWRWVPASVLAGWAAGLLAAWVQLREAVRRNFTRHLSAAWTEPPAEALDESAAELDASFRDLGYRPVGWLARMPEHPRALVYTHQELPTYAVLVPRLSEPLGGVSLALHTFFEDGGRLSTVSESIAARTLALVRSEAPRLAQLRSGGAPVALDGQHTGTLRAWIAGGRKPVPATREALLRLLEEDHRRISDSLREVGWVPFPSFLRWQFGAPSGVLTF